MSSKSNFEEEKSGQEGRLPSNSNLSKVDQAANFSRLSKGINPEKLEKNDCEISHGESDLAIDNEKPQNSSDPLASLYSLITELNLVDNVDLPTNLHSLNSSTSSIEQPAQSTSANSFSKKNLVSDQLSKLTPSELSHEHYDIRDLDKTQLNKSKIEQDNSKQSNSNDKSGQSNQIGEIEALDSQVVKIKKAKVVDLSKSEAISSESGKLEYSDAIYDRNYIESLTKQDSNPELSTVISAINIDVPDSELGIFSQVSPHWIVEKERQINDLANSINALLPLVVELSQAQTNTSREHILKVLVPIIDQVIQKRSSEDQQKMAKAIANILPTAIQQEIRQEPKSIGQAIAPELALSITEQIRIDENAIAEALGSEMGKAIKNQIEQEREAMVDALYPVIGSTIAKYMAEVIESINERVDNALSPQGIQRKIRAKLQGVSEAELILRESIPYRVQAVFLIQNNSGLVISEVQPEHDSQLESDLLAGMLTAIRSFANDCIASNSELDEIDYGNFKIMFETAGYCYLAVVVKGEADQRFSKQMKYTLEKIIQKYGNEIKSYQGEQDTELTVAIKRLLEKLLTYNIRHNLANSENNSTKSPKTLYWLLVIFASLILIPWGTLSYRNYVRQSIEKEVAIKLDANPELSVYRLTPKIKKQKIVLKGRVPNEYLVGVATQVTAPVAQKVDLGLDNQIVAVNIPPDPILTKQEVERTLRIVNQQNSLDHNQRAEINAEYLDKTVTLRGSIFDESTQKKLIENFKTIPGVENVIFVISGNLPKFNTRIYYASRTTKVTSLPELVKLDKVMTFLEKYPLLGLKLVSHSDQIGSKEANRKLGQLRTQSLYQNLISRGINPNRLQVSVTTQPPPDILDNQPSSVKRCIRFEPFVVNYR